MSSSVRRGLNEDDDDEASGETAFTSFSTTIKCNSEIVKCRKHQLWFTAN